MIRSPVPLARRRKNLRVRCALLLARIAPGWCSGQLHRPVFVVGCARSGTTLLAAMLGDHPQIAEWSEANSLWDPGWFPWRPELQGEPPLEVDTAAFNERWWRQNRHRRRDVAAAFGAYQALEGRELLLNKSPFHTFRVPQLLELFPEARFVHLVRDGRAVAHSYANHLLHKGKLREWPAELARRFESDPEGLVVHAAGVWSRSLCEVAACDRRLALSARGLLIELSYEELIAEPAATLVRLHRFLAVKPRPGDAGRRLLRDQNHKWRAALSAETRRELAARLAADLEARGYAP